MLHTIYHEQVLHCDRQRAWDFISAPENLAQITPRYMDFKVLRGGEGPMHQGQIIEYHVRPLLRFKFHWVTEITHVKEGEYFVDEQRFGPYTFWHHQHRLSEVPEGVKMTDIVHYKLPFGILGRVVNQLLVKKQLAGIFEYRKKILGEMFGVPEQGRTGSSS